MSRPTTNVAELLGAFRRGSSTFKEKSGYPLHHTLIHKTQFSFRWLIYHTYTLYLFTASDVVSVLWPQVVFAISFVRNPSVNNGETLDSYNIILRLPYAIVWIWLQLLVLDLSNQRHVESVVEDTLNKPWRPIPSGRLTEQHARQLLLASIPVTYVLSQYTLGGTFETVALFVLNWIYNDLDASGNWILRNVLNSVGITCIGAGARAVIAGGSTRTLDHDGQVWLVVCAAVILTTIQAQDLYDQEGDSKRGRKTMPLVLGDTAARWLTAGPVMLWSVAIPLYWSAGSLLGWAVSLFPGVVVGVRLLKFRDVKSDRKTFKFWALWLIGVYAIPAIKATFG
jgi:4-hydroxybenzoate polyprenyltransferase